MRPLAVEGALEAAESFAQAWGAMLSRCIAEGRDVDPRDCSSAFALLHDALVEVRALRGEIARVVEELEQEETWEHEAAGAGAAWEASRNENVQLRATLEQRTQALRALVEKLTAIENDKSFAAQFVTAALHNHPYTGPNWLNELYEARQALGREGAGDGGEGMSMMWVPFAQEKYAQQELPRERRYVLVQIAGEDGMGMPPSVAVGYLRFAAGDPDSPYFVVPGFGRRFVVVSWSDSLGDGFYAPLWAGKQTSVLLLVQGCQQDHPRSGVYSLQCGGYVCPDGSCVFDPECKGHQ